MPPEQQMRKPTPPINNIMQLSRPPKHNTTDKTNHEFVDAAQTNDEEATVTDNNHEIIDAARNNR